MDIDDLLQQNMWDRLSYYGFMNEYETLGEWSAMKTFEHLAPEYDETGKEVSKVDVFAFGVVLLELITGRKTIENIDGQSYLSWVSSSAHGSGIVCRN